MAAMAEQRRGAIEQEMPTYQRDVIDTCLEEGQFESAISLMEQLRSSTTKPPPHHIRQLIYISLLPEDTSEHDPIPPDIPSSPSKAPLKKRNPPKRAIAAARRLLKSYVVTNLPASVARALPDCETRKDSLLLSDDGSLESVIGQQSMHITKAKDCWSILTQDFIKKSLRSKTVATGKRKARTYNADPEDDEVDACVQNAVVGHNAWAVLDWLILLFEQDEILAEERGLDRHSNLLLQQIPPPRNGSGPRWDVSAPLGIIFFCFEQSELRRQMLGSRLVNLLINLSSIQHLDLSMFISSVYSRLTATNLEKLPAFFAALCPSSPSHVFKVALCQKLLANSTQSDPAVRVRAQPRARRPEGSTIRNTKSPVSRDNSFAQPLTRVSLPRYSEIKEIMEAKESPLADMPAHFDLMIKFELLNSYGTLQSNLPIAQRDSEWVTSLRDEKVGAVIDLAFSSDVFRTHYTVS